MVNLVREFVECYLEGQNMKMKTDHARVQEFIIQKLDIGTMGRLSMDIAMPMSGADLGICMSLVFMYGTIII